MAEANAIGNSEITAGTTLKVPDVGQTKNDATTFKPYNPAETIGNTSPTLPYIEPPKDCNALVMILMVVIVVVVTVFTAGAMTYGVAGMMQGMTGIMGAGMATLGGAAGVGAAVAAGAVGAFAGSVASQAVGSALGATSFSWRGAVASGIAGGLTAGIGATFGGAEGLSSLIKAGSWGKVAAAAALSATSGYVANKIAGVEDTHFSWKAIAASAVTSVIAGKINKKLGTVFEQYASNGIVRDTIGGMVSGVVSLHVRRAFGFDDAINYGNIAADAFGNALANAAMAGVNKAELQQIDEIGSFDLESALDNLAWAEENFLGKNQIPDQIVDLLNEIAPIDANDLALSESNLGGMQFYKGRTTTHESVVTGWRSQLESRRESSLSSGFPEGTIFGVPEDDLLNIRLLQRAAELRYHNEPTTLAREIATFSSNAASLFYNSNLDGFMEGINSRTDLLPSEKESLIKGVQFKIEDTLQALGFKTEVDQRALNPLQSWLPSKQVVTLGYSAVAQKIDGFLAKNNLVVPNFGNVAAASPKRMNETLRVMLGASFDESIQAYSLNFSPPNGPSAENGSSSYYAGSRKHHASLDGADRVGTIILTQTFTQAMLNEMTGIHVVPGLEDSAPDPSLIHPEGRIALNSKDRKRFDYQRDQFTTPQVNRAGAVSSRADLLANVLNGLDTAATANLKSKGVFQIDVFQAVDGKRYFEATSFGFEKVENGLIMITPRSVYNNDRIYSAVTAPLRYKP